LVSIPVLWDDGTVTTAVRQVLGQWPQVVTVAAPLWLLKKNPRTKLAQEGLLNIQVSGFGKPNLRKSEGKGKGS